MPPSKQKKTLSFFTCSLNFHYHRAYSFINWFLMVPKGFLIKIRIPLGPLAWHFWIGGSLTHGLKFHCSFLPLPRNMVLSGLAALFMMLMKKLLCKILTESHFSSQKSLVEKFLLRSIKRIAQKQILLSKLFIESLSSGNSAGDWLHKAFYDFSKQPQIKIKLTWKINRMESSNKSRQKIEKFIHLNRFDHGYSWILS